MKIVTDKQIKHKAAVAYAFGKIRDRLHNPLLFDLSEDNADEWGVETYELCGYYLQIVENCEFIGKGTPDCHEWEVACRPGWLAPEYTLYNISEEAFTKGA